jgi:hypothetical protein
MTPDQIGEYLEHQGATDDEIDEFLEHFGVKGMKWGVRRDNRANNFKKVGKTNNATTSAKLRAYTHLGPIDFIKGGGLKGGAARKGDRLLDRNKRIRNGEAGAMDMLKYWGGTKYQDIIPTKKSRTNTKAALGASIAGAMILSIGMSAITSKATSG